MRIRTIVLTLILAVGLAACGDKGGSGDGTGGGSNGAGSNGVAVEQGGATPKALVDRAMKAAREQDVQNLLACVYPEHRAVISFSVGTMGMQMMIGMGRAMAEMMPGGSDPETTAKLDAMQADLDALFAKHGMEGMGADGDDGPGLDLSSLDAMIELSNEKMAGVDHVAFLADSFVLQAKYADEEEKGKNPFGDMIADVDHIDESGDTATVHFKGDEDEPVRLEKHDGRWFVFLTPPDDE